MIQKITCNKYRVKQVCCKCFNARKRRLALKTMLLAIITFSAVLNSITIQYVGIKGNCNKSKHQLHKVSSEYYTLKEKEVFGLNLADFQTLHWLVGFLLI